MTSQPAHTLLDTSLVLPDDGPLYHSKQPLTATTALLRPHCIPQILQHSLVGQGVNLKIIALCPSLLEGQTCSQDKPLIISDLLPSI